MATTRPAAHSTIIKRPRLTKLLDESEARVLLLCAPAGYGKTTLAREWLATRTEPVAWYRGGIEMLDAAAVALGLIEVLRGIGLSDDDAARLRARASRSNRPADLGRAIGSAVPKPCDAILAIDDYHHAESPESESLLGAFVEANELRILVTSRTRPAWLTPRMLVYGDALDVGADELAFTDDEASAVMADDSASRPDSLVARARGWPAVIGLAARQKGAGPTRTDSLLPAELYEYFADDLFRRAPAHLHRSLFLLALAGGTDSQVTQELLGEECEGHLGEAAERGFIARSPGLQFEMHPLLQAFLLARLHELGGEQSGEIVGRALRSLGRARRWDDCLAVLAEFAGTALATSLLEGALDELLASGRIATIKRWLSLTPSTGRDRAVLLLAEAEVAIREGLDAHALTMGEQAAELSAASELAARAHLVAARAAHMLCDDVATRKNAQRAAALTTVTHTRIEARWVEFSCALEAEDGHAREVLSTLRSLSQGAPEHALRVRQASGYLMFMADGDVRRAVRELEPAMGLLRHVVDPLAATAFLNIFSMAWLYLAEYERALELADLQIETAQASGLDFAADHALITRAAALMGLRKLVPARRVINDLESRSAQVSGFIANGARLQSARLRSTVGDLQGAEILLRGPFPDDLPRACAGERLAVRALYLAALGEISDAREAVREARATSIYVDTQGLGELALVVARLQEQPRACLTSDDQATLAEIIKRGQLDPLVIACRAYPTLAKYAASDQALGRELTRVLGASRDVDIGRAAGLVMPRELRKTEVLSNREREVYELVAQGRSNREIAKALFISESTTKVHVRHIFEKLKVHTRAEAVAANIPDDA